MADEGAASPPAAGDVSREMSEEQRVAEAKEEVADFLEGLLDAIEIEGTVEVSLDASGRVEAAISGAESGLLIGKRGKTLEAIQELTRAAVQRHVGFGIKVSVDVEGYRERRRQTILELTEEMMEEAAEAGEAELEAMSAYERKIVHDLVAERDGFTSFSEGDDPDRRVIIRSTQSTSTSDPEK